MARIFRPRVRLAEERELEGLFEEIESAEAAVEGLTARLADPATYRRERAAIAQVERDLEAARERAAKLTARREELESRKAECAARS